MRIPTFESRTVGGLHVATAGAGPPVLLLHGFPQTHVTWRHVAPALTDQFMVVCPDLPGYGSSEAPSAMEAFSKRATAARMVELMAELGHPHFAVIGHDRGALVAFRAALDHPNVVNRVGMIDVIPTADMWSSLSGPGGVWAFHLYLLAHPTDLPERMIAAAPEAFYSYFLDTWTEDEETIPPDVREEYLTTVSRPEVTHAICQDYRASAFVDADHDEADRAAGRRIEIPALAIWQDPGNATLPFDPKKIWQNWTTDLSTLALPGGHFLPEARPKEVTTAIRELLA